MTRRMILFSISLWCAGLVFFLTGSPSSLADELLTKTGKPLFLREESIMETTPVYWQGRAVLFGSIRLGGSTHTPDMLALRIVDLATGEPLATFGTGCSLGCAFVENTADGETFHVYAARQPEGETWFRDIIHFSSRDLVNWDESAAVAAENEHLLNSSVCRDGDGYLMSYESDTPVQFCFKFAKSRDLIHWEKAADTYYAGPDGKSYSACPMIRRCGDYYYVIYLKNYGDGHFFSDIIRSKDLVTWEPSPLNPILVPTEEEGINNSDVDLFEQDGKVRFVYATGDQQTWCDVRDAYFDGSLSEFFAACYPENGGKYGGWSDR